MPEQEPNFNEIKTRIQHKIDTQENWDTRYRNIKALDGELIIYKPDTTHTYARLKIGDGETPIANLPFIDAGTVNGKIVEEVVQIYANYESFPQVGDNHNLDPQQMSLYVDSSNGRLYYWNRDDNNYALLGGLSYSPVTQTINLYSGWNAGSPTSIDLIGNTLTITAGTAPTLTSTPQTVVTGILAR